MKTVDLNKTAPTTVWALLNNEEQKMLFPQLGRDVIDGDYFRFTSQVWYDDQIFTRDGKFRGFYTAVPREGQWMGIGTKAGKDGGFNLRWLCHKTESLKGAVTGDDMYRLVKEGRALQYQKYGVEVFGAFDLVLLTIHRGIVRLCYTSEEQYRKLKNTPQLMQQREMLFDGVDNFGDKSRQFTLKYATVFGFVYQGVQYTAIEHYAEAGTSRQWFILSEKGGLYQTKTNKLTKEVLDELIR